MDARVPAVSGDVNKSVKATRSCRKDWFSGVAFRVCSLFKLQSLARVGVVLGGAFSSCVTMFSAQDAVPSPAAPPPPPFTSSERRPEGSESLKTQSKASFQGNSCE